MWNRYPGLMAFGTTVWGLRRIAYWTGYTPYYNGYYTGDAAPVDYGQPILAEPPYEEPVDAGTTQATELPPGVSRSGMTAFEKAQSAFKDGNYKLALSSVDEALKELPRDAVVNEFRALVLFALGDYKHSAETVYAVLSVGPGWDWTTLSGLYGNVSDYTKQLRALETYVDKNTSDAAGHFVLGYHYLTCNHKDSAIKQFQQVVKLNPKDTVSASLLTTLGVTAAPKTSSSPPAKKPPTIPIDSLAGNWKATRGSASFELNLTKDKNFTWTYSEGKRKTTVKGVFAIDGDTIAMEPDAGGVMLAALKLQQAGELSFKMAGDEKDPGLVFKK